MLGENCAHGFSGLTILIIIVPAIKASLVVESNLETFHNTEHFCCRCVQKDETILQTIIATIKQFI